MHQCSECLSTEENPYSTSLCKSHQIQLQMWMLEDLETAQQGVQLTAIAVGGLAFCAGVIISWLVFRGIARRN